MGVAIVWLVNTIITLMIWFIIAAAIMSWLIAFNVVNVRNGFVYQIYRFLDAVTQPVLGPVQRIIPSLGGVDISPIVVLLGLQFIRILFNSTLAPYIKLALG